LPESLASALWPLALEYDVKDTAGISVEAILEFLFK